MKESRNINDSINRSLQEILALGEETTRQKEVALASARRNAANAQRRENALLRLRKKQTGEKSAAETRARNLQARILQAKDEGRKIGNELKLKHLSHAKEAAKKRSQQFALEADVENVRRSFQRAQWRRVLIGAVSLSGALAMLFSFSLYKGQEELTCNKTAYAGSLMIICSLSCFFYVLV